MGTHEKDSNDLSDLYNEHNATVKAVASYVTPLGAAIGYDQPREVESDPVEEAQEMFKRDTLAFRVWVYKVTMAALIIITGFTTWQAITLEDWTRLLEAALSLGGVGIANMARKNVR